MKKSSLLKKVASAAIAAMMLLLCVACANNPDDNPVNDATAAPTAEPTAVPEKTIQEYLDLIATTEWKEAKNVILLIGDGMGKNHVNATKAILGGRYADGKMTFDYFTNFGENETICTEGEPDSASGGTALATGYKSKRKYLGMNNKKVEVQNVVELAKSLGKATGVITSESIVDATPAAFTIHNPDRNDESYIAELEIAASSIDFLVGGGKAMYDKAFSKNADLIQYMKDNNISYCTTWDDVLKYKLGNGRVIGTLTEDFFEDADKASPTLAEMTKQAINVLKENDKGFFLMVEGGAMDETAHEADIMELVKQMQAFDDAIAEAIKFAVDNPDTIIIVTADHNTGGILPTEEATEYIKKHPTGNGVADVAKKEKIYTDAKKYGDLDLLSLPYRNSTIAHTNDPVYVYAIGAGTEVFNDVTVKTFEIGKFIGKAISGQEFGSEDPKGIK